MHINCRMVVCLLALGCGDGKDNEDDTGFRDDTRSGEGSGCEVVEETALSVDETTPGGTSVADAITILQAEHAANLTWNDGTTTDLTVTITDVRNPRFEDHEVVASGSGDVPLIEIACNDQLVFDIQLAIVTADGQLNESVAHTAIQLDGALFPTIFLDVADATGTFNPTDWTEESFDRIAANFTAEWNEAGIQGVIDGFGETEDGQVVSAARIEYATFTSAGTE